MPNRASIITLINIEFFITAGKFASSMAGPAMAVAIGYALKADPMVLFSLIAVGQSANELGKAGGPLAVLFVAIIACEVGKLVSKETKIDILVTPCLFIDNSFSFVIVSGLPASTVYSISVSLYTYSSIIVSNLSKSSLLKEVGVPPPI